MAGVVDCADGTMSDEIMEPLVNLPGEWNQPKVGSSSVVELEPSLWKHTQIGLSAERHHGV